MLSVSSPTSPLSPALEDTLLQPRFLPAPPPHIPRTFPDSRAPVELTRLHPALHSFPGYVAATAKSLSVVSDSVRPHRGQPTRLRHPWDSLGKNTGVGCHFLLQCMKMKGESEVAQLCLTLSDPMDCSPPGSSIHGILQTRVLEWGAIAYTQFPGMC